MSHFPVSTLSQFHCFVSFCRTRQTNNPPEHFYSRSLARLILFNPSTGQTHFPQDCSLVLLIRRASMPFVHPRGLGISLAHLWAMPFCCERARVRHDSWAQFLKFPVKTGAGQRILAVARPPPPTFFFFLPCFRFFPIFCVFPFLFVSTLVALRQKVVIILVIASALFDSVVTHPEPKKIRRPSNPYFRRTLVWLCYIRPQMQIVTPPVTTLPEPPLTDRQSASMNSLLPFFHPEVCLYFCRA